MPPPLAPCRFPNRGDFPGRRCRLRCPPSPLPVHNDAAATWRCGPRRLRERGYAMGFFFGVVGGHVTDHMLSASSRPTQLPPTTQSRMTTGAVMTTCKVPVPPAPLPLSSFANDPERRGDDEEEEWGRQRRHRAPRPCMDVRRADGRRDRGVVDAAVVEPCGPKFGGG